MMAVFANNSGNLEVIVRNVSSALSHSHASPSDWCSGTGHEPSPHPSVLPLHLLLWSTVFFCSRFHA